VGAVKDGFEVETDDEGAAQVYDEVFTRYYGGCGEAYSFALVDVPVNKPFIGWDLD
jgi:hypothetical protein